MHPRLDLHDVCRTAQSSKTVDNFDGDGYDIFSRVCSDFIEPDLTVRCSTGDTLKRVRRNELKEYPGVLESIGQVR